MKKLLTLLFLVGMFSFSPGQVYYGERYPGDKPTENKLNTGSRGMGDFTVVDSDGIERNLYSLLENGYTVIIDLFFST